MLLAPILAVTLALLLAGAVNSIDFPSEEVKVTGSIQNYGVTTAPATMETMAFDLSASPILFFAGAVVVGLVAFLLFFREKSLNKELSH